MANSQLKLSYSALTDEDYVSMNEMLNRKDTLGVLKWAYETFDDDLVYACSFGAEGIVLIDHIYKVRPKARIVFLDTHLHFKETYELIEEVKAKYPLLDIQMAQTELSLEQQAELYGTELWKSNPDQCCSIRKMKPLTDTLAKSRAWISGLRREQSPTRANTQFINKDNRFESIKICPLIHWSWEDVWGYIRLNQLPYNKLHDQGYPSIGCETCTFQVKEGEDMRSGRWAGFNKTECGLHK